MDNTEKYIYHLYKSIDIASHDLLSIDYLASLFNIDMHFWEFSSAIAHRKGKYKMYINENLNKRQQWQVFGHEMKHYIFDEENKLHLPNTYTSYQEHKADYFAYHFCVPTFMLQKLKGVTVYDVMNLFNVEFDFALRRLEMYKSKLMSVAESKVIYR